MEITRDMIKQGKTSLGIELGSTRIKAVLIDDNYLPIATGGFDWENSFKNDIWTYSLEYVWIGLQTAFCALAADVRAKYDIDLKNVGSIGISAMMHGYLAIDASGNQLVDFRTWRNTITAEATEILSDNFGFAIPQRWSIAHLYQAILNGEEHVGDIAFLTTLSGYIHWKLSGEKVLGIGDASGMFPIDSATLNYDAGMMHQFSEIIEDKGYLWHLPDLLPRVLSAGSGAGKLTEEGARLLSPEGILQAGIPLCPPEGDAGTGMVATNSVRPRTGNISAGTSIFAMLVLEDSLSKVYPEIDMVTTPSGSPVAMVHCNNCTSDIDAWVKLFGEFAAMTGTEISKPELYDMLYNAALHGNAEKSGLMVYNYYSGEHITGIEYGHPLLVRNPESQFNIANLMRTILFSAVATLKIGMEILEKNENIALDQIMGHGGLFKTKNVGQAIMASALNVPVAIMDSAGEGGAWGIALLAAYMLKKHEKEALADFLENKVFANMQASKTLPNLKMAKDFEVFMQYYKKGLDIERAAAKSFSTI